MPSQVEAQAEDADLQQQYKKQQEYNERNLAVLRKKVMKDKEMQHTAYMRIMQVISLFLVLWSGNKGNVCTKETLLTFLLVKVQFLRTLK